MNRSRSPPPPPPPPHYYALDAYDLHAEDEDLDLSDNTELDPDVVFASVTPPPRTSYRRRLLFDVPSDGEDQVVPRAQHVEEEDTLTEPEDENFVNPGTLLRDYPALTSVSSEMLHIDAERLQIMLDRTVETIVGRLLGISPSL